MSPKFQDVTFVVTRNNAAIFEQNFAASPCLEGLRPEQIIVQEGFSSAAAAYNDAIERANTDLLVFAHQDVYFPEDWLDNLDRSLKILERSDPDWGVLGGWGVDNRGLQAGYLYSVGLVLLGKSFVQPVKIDTLDEYFLIMRKRSGLRFDPNLSHFHLYGTDICLSARKNNMSCYAISAFSIHNTGNGKLPREFFDVYWRVKKKWKEFLPIQTPCIRITRWNEELIVRKLKLVYFKFFRKEYGLHDRLEDPRSALKFEASHVNSSD
jgi:hypothetical protein